MTRPLFLVGGVLLYLLGAFAAAAAGATLDFKKLLIGQALVTFIQLMTHYTNEYFDIEGDRLNAHRTWFSGGSGVLASGDLPPKAALYAAISCAILGLLALIIASQQAAILSIFGLLGLLAAWSYSGPPLTLARTGWGELTASFLVAMLVPLVGYAMQSGGRVSPVILMACIPLILIHLAMLIAFQIPDRIADAQSGKRTLLVRLGAQTVARLHNLALFAAAGLILTLSLIHWPGAQFVWLALPLAFWQTYRINQVTGTTAPRYGWFTTGALALFALTGAFLAAGFFVLWHQSG